MEQKMTLMNKNHKILQMVYDDEIHAILKISDIYDLAYAPPAILNNKGLPNRRTLNEWWLGRAIPASRNHLKQDLPYVRDTRWLMEQNLGLSLSDRYWVTDDPDSPGSLKWENVNFFDNPFSEDLGLITLGERSLSYYQHENLYSPNATLGGDLRKKWTIQNGMRTSVKSGSGNLQQEPYNEAVASALHRRLLPESDFVEYTLQGHYSACQNMLGPDEELVPMFDILTNHKKPGHLNDYQFCLKLCNGLEIPEEKARNHFEKMFTCDFILANRDRHYRNFGLIRNVETLAYTRMAPIYDTGGCLWHDKPELTRLSDYYYVAKPFNPNGMDPKDQLELFHDFAWFDESSLNGFTEEASEILSKNPYMSDARRDAAITGIEHNLDYVTDYVKQYQKKSYSVTKPVKSERNPETEFAASIFEKSNEREDDYSYK